MTILQNSAKQYAKKIALIEAEQEKVIYYEELYEKIEKYALFLMTHGIQPAQRVAIYMPNSCEYIVALFALFYICAVPVLIDHRFSEREVKESLKTTATDTLITSVHQQKICINIHNQTALKQIFIFSPEEISPPFINCTLDSSLEAGKTSSTCKNNTTAINKQINPDSGQRQLILFTYRGLGCILPVLLNEQSIEANIHHNNELTQINEQTVISLILPLSHIFALSSNFLSPLSVGATIVIINTIAPTTILTFFEYYKLNLLAAVPSQIYVLLHCLKKKHYNLSLLKRGVIGGDSFSREQFQNWQELTGGSILVQGYGLTETCAVICNNWRDNRPESMGKVMQGVSAQVRDETGKRILINKPGCLWIKTDSLMEGYLNQPSLNRQTMQAGWFDTGDQTIQDQDGYFYFIKRIKPIAKIGATTVDLLEIKEVLSQIPGIKEVQIELGKDPLWQEKVICSLKTNKPLTSTDIKAYCKPYLAYYKIPKDINILYQNT